MPQAAAAVKQEKDILTISGQGSVEAADLNVNKETVREIVIEDGISQIGSEAFKDFSHLEKVTIPSTVRKIGSDAFQGCSALKTVTLTEENIQSIAVSSFPKNDSLLIRVPAGSRTFKNGKWYFWKAVGTYKVVFEAGEHGKAPDQQIVDSGKTVQKPEELKADGYVFGGWFTDKEYTAEYDFSSAVTKDLTLYAKWTKKTEDQKGDGNTDPKKDGSQDPKKDDKTDPKKDGGTDPKKDDKTGTQQTENTDGKKEKKKKKEKAPQPYTAVQTEAMFTPTAAEKRLQTVVVKDTVTIKKQELPVTGIAAGAFRNDPYLRKLVIGSNVKTILSGAFQGTRNLARVRFSGDSLVKIDSNAFRGAKKLQKVDLSDQAGLSYIGGGAFKDCKKLKKLLINGDSLKFVGKGAFKGTNRKIRVIVIAENEKIYNRTVKKLSAAGLKNAEFVFRPEE
jgi:uncharacterized repeat protein (TIGR02543 family)